MKEIRYFYVPNAATVGELPEEEAKHAVKVLRLQSGDRMVLVDGEGGLFDAEVSVASGKHCLYNILETLPYEREWRGSISLAIAPTNAAAPMTANTFLLVFFFAALQIRAAQATQTAAAISAMPSVSHNHDNSLIQFITSPVFLHSLPDALSPLSRISYRCSAAAYKRAGWRKTADTSRTSLDLRL